ncbi:hypothetical protein CU097_007720 [Rhizopus azygosporus]|uniref:DNA2/NAM7 helicase-like C-terminal domain-containing protein n=1 Tax=Rhizopus azygosporus TaxID=86630 RepID=A0A367JYN9_RHIAZ|nr:hypothetical protein CU097_007720 [Rhizopus azygosporus]
MPERLVLQLHVQAIPKFSISTLASGSFYDCEKHYYLLSKPQPNNEQNFEISSKSLHMKRGIVFEERLFEMHKSSIVNHTNTTDFIKALREAKHGQYLYQLRFSLPEEFYRDVIGDVKTYRIRNFIPDFLYIKEDPATKIKKILIIDAKSSNNMSSTHQFQVVSYAFLIDYLIRDMPDLEVDALGGVWLPEDMEKPQMFRIDLVMGKIKLFYKKKLIDILKSSKPEWNLGAKCSTCSFYAQCKEDAKGTVKQLPYMNWEKLSMIRESTPEDIEDLSGLLQNMSLHEHSFTRDMTNIQQYILSYESKKPIFLGHVTTSTAKDVDHAIYTSFLVDTYSRKPYAYAFHIFDFEEGVFLQDSFSFCVNASAYQLDDDKDNDAYCKFTDEFINHLSTLLNFMDRRRSRCLFYVYSNKTRDAIGSFLYDLIASKGKRLVSLQNKRRIEILEAAAKCLVTLFQGVDLLGLSTPIAFPCMEEDQKLVGVERFVSIENLLEQNIALPASVCYELSDAVEWMASAYIKKGISLDSLYDESIHKQWLKREENGSNGEQVVQLVVQKLLDQLNWLHAVMETYWMLANDYMESNCIELFPLPCIPFKWPETRYFNHSILAKLTYFKQLECISACNTCRRDPIADLDMLRGHKMFQPSSSLILGFRSEHRLSKFEVSLQFEVIDTETKLHDPKGSGKTEFLSRFINWYILNFVRCNGLTDLMIGVTAFTNASILNLLKRIEDIQKQYGLEDLFSIIFATYDTKEDSESAIKYVKWRESLTVVNKLKKESGIRVFVIGATVYSWNNIKDNWKSFKGCRMMLIDEGSQLLVSDALLAIKCLSFPRCRLIVAGDHMQLGPILANDYSKLIVSAKDPLLYGSIQQCLMRTEHNDAISTRAFLLQKDSVNDFGPNTLQLKDNWRMNDEMNRFFKLVYGPDLISRNPERKLKLREKDMKDDLVRSILDPSRAISLVNVQVPVYLISQMQEVEANIVCKLVDAYLGSLKEPSMPVRQDAPKVMVIAPYVKQCVAIKRRLNNVSDKILVGTVDKMQGQESDLIIACYVCKLNDYRNDFLVDFRRWNVTLSRAKCKVVVLAIDSLFEQNVHKQIVKSLGSSNFEPVDGLALLCLLNEWTTQRKSSHVWVVE